MERNKILNLAAVLSLLVDNYVMTINQVNVASTFNLISREFGVTVFALGTLTAAFFLAYAIFEVPGGIVATKLGPKKVVVCGTAMNALGVIGGALAPGVGLLTALRFVSGLGFAFAFPSTLVLIVRYYKAGSEGFGVGLMSIATAVGSATGLMGWAVLATTTGWRWSLLLSGFLDLAALVMIVLMIPADSTGPRFALKLGHLKEIITDKPLAVLSLAMFGIGSTFALVSNFMVYYLEGTFGISAGYAGLISSISALLPIVSAPIVGRIYDSVKNARLLLLIPAAVISAGVDAAAASTVYAAIISEILVGLASGVVFTVGLAAARDVASSNPEYESLTVAWVDSFALFGNFASPIYFSAVVIALGYPVAWLIGGSVAFLLTIPITTVAAQSLMKRKPPEGAVAEPPHV